MICTSSWDVICTSSWDVICTSSWDMICTSSCAGLHSVKEKVPRFHFQALEQCRVQKRTGSTVGVKKMFTKSFTEHHFNHHSSDKGT